jgi:tetratricopeptide (TPR) repeat protein
MIRNISNRIVWFYVLVVAAGFVAGARDLAAERSPTAEGSLRAEQLLLDGLDRKDQGRYQESIVLLLEALAIDPGFTQAYAHAGDVWLELARQAPTEPEFRAYLALALRSFERVGALAPDSLAACSARSHIRTCREFLE